MSPANARYFCIDSSSDPVLLCNDLGAKRDFAKLTDDSGPTIESSGHQSISVKEAVRIAQSNNFVGLVCSSSILVSATHCHCP